MQTCSWHIMPRNTKNWTWECPEASCQYLFLHQESYPQDSPIPLVWVGDNPKGLTPLSLLTNNLEEPIPADQLSVTYHQQLKLWDWFLIINISNRGQTSQVTWLSNGFLNLLFCSSIANDAAWKNLWKLHLVTSTKLVTIIYLSFYPRVAAGQFVIPWANLTFFCNGTHGKVLPDPPVFLIHEFCGALCFI